jgi:hypothetical protein
MAATLMAMSGMWRCVDARRDDVDGAIVAALPMQKEKPMPKSEEV